MSAGTPQYDVVIIGAGVSGNTIAWQLGLAGKKVLILEAGVAVPDSREEYMENFYLALAKVPEAPYPAIAGRTSVERVNARLKVFWGVDDGNIRGARRLVAEVGVVLAVHAAFATLLASSPRREGTLGKPRLSPIAEARRAKAAAV